MTFLKLFTVIFNALMTQQEVADKLYLDRSTVSKVVDRYL